MRRTLCAARPFPYIDSSISYLDSQAFVKLQRAAAKVQHHISAQAFRHYQLHLQHGWAIHRTRTFGAQNNDSFRLECASEHRVWKPGLRCADRFLESYIWDLSDRQSQHFAPNVNSFNECADRRLATLGIVTLSSGHLVYVTDANANSRTPMTTASGLCAGPERQWQALIAGTFFNTCAFADPQPDLSKRQAELVTRAGL